MKSTNLCVRGAGIVANGLGKLTYLPTIRRKMETELPPDSVLRQAAKNFRTGGNWSDFVENSDKSSDDPGLVFDSGDTSDNSTQESKKFVSYSDLQKQHRQRHGWPSNNENAGDGRYASKMPLRNRADEGLGEQKDPVSVYDSDNQDSFPQLRDHSDDQRPATGQPARYNKYGDLIIE